MPKAKSYGICPYQVKDEHIYILLIRAKGHDEWGFIKGHKEEFDISAKHTALRESTEETNISFDIKDLEDFYLQKNKRKDVGIYTIKADKCDMSNIILQPREVHEIKWFYLLSQINIAKNSEQILTDIRNDFY
jgi:8-oxo-dGTP pyrophosphatase MutT (NUDIX family)